MKERLRAVATALDPLRLLDEIRSAQGHLAAVAAGEPLRAVEHRDGDLDAFLKSLSTAWHEGEVRPTHRAGPRAPRHWRTWKDPFEAVWPNVLAWLQVEPDRTATELLLRLQQEHPGEYPDKNLRTL